MRCSHYIAFTFWVDNKMLICNPHLWVTSEGQASSEKLGGWIRTRVIWFLRRKFCSSSGSCIEQECNIHIFYLAAAEDRKLFIGGLSWETHEAQLTEYFEKFGTVESVNLKMNPLTGKSRCFAFVVFKSSEDVVSSSHSKPVAQAPRAYLYTVYTIALYQR